MDIDSAKKQARALMRALQALGVARLDASTALEVVARMNGYRNWSTARHVGEGIGRWNSAQLAVHANWHGTMQHQPRPGEDYGHCEPLFVAVMDVAGGQPLTRAGKTIEYWAQVVDELCAQAAWGDACEVPRLSARLAVPFARALRAQLVGDPAERLQRLRETRDLLYEVALALRRLVPVSCEQVLLLDSRDGCDYLLAVGVPAGRSLEEAAGVAERVLETLMERSPDYGAAALLVHLAQQGLAPVNHAFGPVWDSMD